MDWSSFWTGFGVGIALSLFAVAIQFYVRVLEPKRLLQRKALEQAKQVLSGLRHFVGESFSSGETPHSQQAADRVFGGSTFEQQLQKVSSLFDLPKKHRRWIQETAEQYGVLACVV